jgi:dihydroneopterin aldolase
MDKIQFNGMQFYAYHGVFPEENKLGQTYYVDLEVYADLHKAGHTDHLEDTINYADLYQIVKVIMEEERYKLIEAVAEKIASVALDRIKEIQEIIVKVTKPNPPIAGQFESVAVEISRRRSV